MAEDYVRRNLPLAWRLSIAILVGLTLTVMALVWPAVVRGDTPPEIIQVEVSSSQGSFFYSEPLDTSGGTTYFNNLSADQIITVTVTVSDDNPTAFSGGDAFGIAPTTNISTSNGNTSSWSVAYTIRGTDSDEPDILFTITDADTSTDTVTISFIQDITGPVINSPAIIEDSQYLHAVGTTDIYYGDDMVTAVPFSVTGNADDTGAGLDRATFSTALGVTPPDDTTPSTWMAGYAAESTDIDQGNIIVTVYDKVDNSVTQTFAYMRDIQEPGTVFNFVRVPDADSGNDGFAPDTKWEDDLTADFTWSASNDPGGSGIAGYHVNSSLPVASAYFTTPGGPLTMVDDGAYNFFIRAEDNVGNLGGQTLVMGGPPFNFDTDAPENGRLNLYEESGGEYLYIADGTDITAGTLFYSNLAASSFAVNADDTGTFSWGAGSSPWKVVYSPGLWGQSDLHEIQHPNEYTHTYDITPFETTDAFTVYYVNKAGNVQAIMISAVLDIEDPQVVFSDVTDPDYDPDGDELNDGDPEDNWYRISALPTWAFTTNVAETGAGYATGLANWDHLSDDNDDKTTDPAFDGTHTLTGAFSGVQNDSDGTVQITVVATDHVNNEGSATLAIQLDRTPPVITPSGWSESSPYLHVIGDELFFSHMMASGQSATLSGFAADNQVGSGLHRAEFSDETNLAGSPSSPDFTASEWSGSYTFADVSTQGDGSALVTVYDNVGNATTQGLTYTLDIASPVVAYTGVTDPGYDPDGDELNNDGNWYSSNNLNDGWVFFFEYSDSQTGARLASADWDHSNDSDDQIGYEPGLDGIGVFGTGGSGSSGTAVDDDADGVVSVPLRIEDNVGNVGYDSLNLRIDNIPPTITNDGWTESSDYLHADGNTLYFSHLMGAVEQLTTLSGHADDGPDGAGAPGQAGITGGTSLGFSLPDYSLPDWSIQYHISDGASDSDSPVQVSVPDNLGNQTLISYPFVLDDAPPTTPTNFTIDTSPIQPGYYNTRSLNLSWSPSSDSQSRLQGYYLGTSASPSDFYPPPTTAATFDTGADGTFTFYLMAKDNVGHTSLASNGSVTIDTQAPVPWVQATPENYEDRILVEWGAVDPAPGTWPVAYDVEYRVGDTGTPQIWKSDTTDTSAYFGPTSPESVEIETRYYFRVSARDYVNNQSGASAWASGALGLKQTYLPVVIKNYDFSIPYASFDGFENGSFIGWNTGGVLPRSIVSHPVPPPDGTPPNSGAYAALLGSPSYGCGNSPNVPIGLAYIQALAYVPTSGIPRLRFDYRVLSFDTVRSSGGEWWDRLEVQVNGTALARYGDPDPGNLNCSNLYDSGWSQAELDLSAYSGQIVTLTFFNKNHSDGYWNTYSYLDNIRIDTGP